MKNVFIKLLFFQVLSLMLYTDERDSVVSKSVPETDTEAVKKDLSPSDSEGGTDAWEGLDQAARICFQVSL